MRVSPRFRYQVSPRWYRGCLMAGLLLLLAGAVWLSTPGEVTAADSDLSLFLVQYPDLVTTDLNDCGVCHTDDEPELNPYGLDYFLQGRSMAALTQIEVLDSDQDGVINKVEIDVAIEPGDGDEIPELMFIPLIER